MRELTAQRQVLNEIFKYTMNSSEFEKLNISTTSKGFKEIP